MHYVCMLERTEITAEFFNHDFGEFDKDIMFICAGVVHPKAIEYLKGRNRKYLIIPRYLYFPIYIKLKYFDFLYNTPSVAHMSYFLSVLLNHKNIIFIGQDLAYAENGNSHPDDYQNSANYESQMYEHILTEAYGGKKEIKTHEFWIFFKQILEAMIIKYHITTYNCTEGGARIEGTIEKPFLWACENLLDKDLNKPFEKLEPLSLNKQNDFYLRLIIKFIKVLNDGKGEKVRNILVTGADGFIGSHLCESLVKKGFKVRALSQYNSFNFWGHLEKSSFLKDMEVISGDLRDSFFCEKITKNIDAIFHLGALIAIPYSYTAPQSYVDTNVNGTLNMLEAAKKNEISHFIHTSTSEVYGTAFYVPIDEKHPLQPQSPYSASKIAADMMALSYYNSFNLNVNIARPFNTYGPRQSARAIIPTIITQILSGAKEIKLGDLSPKRDLNFVLDTCEGFISLLNLKHFGEVYNIGSGVEYSMQEVLDLIQKILDSKVKIIQDEQRLRPKNSEVFRLCCDANKLKKATNWQSKISLEEGLRQSIEYFKENLENYKSELYNV